MLKEGSPVYLGRDDPSGGRVLRPGIIAAFAQDRCTIGFGNSELSIKTGDERLIYYHEFQEFVQRRVRVEEQSEIVARWPHACARTGRANDRCGSCIAGYGLARARAVLFC